LPDHAWLTELLISPATLGIVLLPFSCSCLVNSSPSKVAQFKFECSPQVQEISSVVHYLPCFGDGFSLCSFTRISALGVYFFASPPFSGPGSVFHQPPLLSVCYDILLFVFQFCRAVMIHMLLTVSGDELCDQLPTLLVHFQHSHPLCCCTRLQFNVLFFFWGGRGQSAQVCAGLSRG
jgi:hypothetical protein